MERKEGIMAEKTTILDMNRFDDSNPRRIWMRTNANWFVAAASLARAIVCSIRTRLQIVRAAKVATFSMKKGNDYLDAYNNVVSVGHCHPHVVEALAVNRPPR